MRLQQTSGFVRVVTNLSLAMAGSPVPKVVCPMVSLNHVSPLHFKIGSSDHAGPAWDIGSTRHQTLFVVNTAADARSRHHNEVPLPAGHDRRDWRLDRT